ncbi:hypothetical protein MMSR116_29015 [Methylobacterium mesophilicum SR1.6/6]|uniref:Uncharacterized protein n=1 Tax=Methylobacterium mesophilicum SR1.6/6 TaxID=908290 RepID=A0A6B9FSA9_9HYPH|nr:hypothetical protein [Methylobacterium mesophilicum]QGY05481.1 hypothetical protein MMSR116_29015 [Methylobacterium mesophilicum SR1.6/6]
MSDNARRELVASRLMGRLSGFIQGIGMSGVDAREIVNRAIADDPSADEHDIEAKARAWMLIALT